MARRTILGHFTDGGYGLRVSKPGYDVMTNPVDNSQLMFNSDWASCFPIHWTSGMFAIGAGGSTNLYFTALGYVPFCSVTYQYGAGSAPSPVGGGNSLPHISSASAALAVQAQNGLVTVINNSHSPTLGVSIVVYRVRAF